MADVLPFARPAETVVERHAVGEAFCFQCDHVWTATAPTGTVQLECPQCHTMKGLFRFPCNLPEGSLVRQCNCGNQLFVLSPDGHLCPNCGTYQTY